MDVAPDVGKVAHGPILNLAQLLANQLMNIACLFVQCRLLYAIYSLEFKRENVLYDL